MGLGFETSGRTRGGGLTAAEVRITAAPSDVAAGGRTCLPPGSRCRHHLLIPRHPWWRAMAAASAVEGTGIDPRPAG